MVIQPDSELLTALAHALSFFSFPFLGLLQIRSSIKVLKMHPNPHLDGLLNALRYTTKHLNDESTPKEVKKMLAA